MLVNTVNVADKITVPYHKCIRTSAHSISVRLLLHDKTLPCRYTGRNGLAQGWAENIRHNAGNTLARPGSYSAASLSQHYPTRGPVRRL